jgi:DNA-3-methyladenine glycosylase II
MADEIKHLSIDDVLVWAKGIRHLKKKDKVLAKIIPKIKIVKRELKDDYLGSIVESIIYQQISGSAGASITKKFKALYKDKFPSSKQFLSTSESKVRKAGISPQKYSYLKDLYTRIHTGKLELRKFKTMDSEKIIEELDEVRGIGRWTAEMFLISSLGRTDVIPMDDLGIRKGIQRAYGLKEIPDRKKMMKLSKNWQPYGTIASIYIWRSLDAAKPIRRADRLSQK